MKNSFNRDAFKGYAGGDFPIAVNVVQDEDALCPLHSHAFCELAIIEGGTGVYQSGTSRRLLKTGDVFFLPPGDCHSYTRQQHLKVLNILWLPKELNFNFLDLKTSPGYNSFFNLEPSFRKRQGRDACLSLTGEQLDFIAGLANRLKLELQQKQSGFLLLANSLLGEIFTHLCRFYTKQTGRIYRRILSVERGIDYINSHYHKPIKRNALAKHVNMSEATFYRHFKEAIGISSTEYLMEFRLKKAEELLRNSAMSMSEISSATGFSNSNYFSFQFRKRFKRAPYKYRKQFLVQ